MADESNEAGRRRATAESEISARGEKPRLILASEALKEDIAPIQPGSKTARIALCGVGVSLGLLGAAVRWGLGLGVHATDGASVAFSAGGAAIAIGLLPFPYTLRAAIGLALGVALMVLGSQAIGPLAQLAVARGPFGEIDRLVTVTILPAALMFRARYRAYRPARAVLAAALVLSAPFVAGEAYVVADSSASLALRAAAVVELLAVACALFGFMGEDTTGAGAVWAALLIAVVAANTALGDLGVAGRAQTWTHTVAALGMICAAVPASFGIYQLLAAALARDARRVSLKREGSPPETSPA